MTLPKYGFSVCPHFSVDKPVDDFSRFLPQGERIPLTAVNLTSTEGALVAAYIWGINRFIHTIHRLYYYYDSHFILI